MGDMERYEVDCLRQENECDAQDDEQTLYFMGDLAEYTGESLELHGSLFYEIKMLEGHLEGKLRHIVNAPRSTRSTSGVRK